MGDCHSSSIKLKTFRTSCFLLVFFFISACSALNPHDVQVDLQEEFPTTKITSFDDALMTLGRMTEIYNSGPLRIQCQQITDFTNTATASAGGELPQSITEMMKSSLNSIGGTVTYIPYDPFFVENSKTTGYSKFENKIIPDVTISGGITEFDRALETRGKNTDAGVETKPFTNVPDWFPGATIGLDFSQAQVVTAASITVDFNLINFQTLSGISRMQTVNTIKVYKGSNEKELGITLFGPTFGLKGSIKKVQGRHAAVRLLTQLSTIQIVGKYLKLPYWRLLPEGKPDQMVMDSVQSSFYQMAQQQQIKAIQRLLYLHNYDVRITGQLDEFTQAALNEYNPQSSINLDTYLNLYTSVPLDSNRYLSIKEVTNSTAKQGVSTDSVATKPSIPTAPNVQAATSPSSLSAPVNESKKKAPADGTAIGYDKIVSMLTSLGVNATEADLSLWTDRTQFKIGERIQIYFKSHRDCHVVIMDLTQDGKVVQLFPNRFHPDSYVFAGRTYMITDDGGELNLEVTGPVGQDQVIAYVSAQPFKLFPDDFNRQPLMELTNNYDCLRSVNHYIDKAQKMEISRKKIQYQVISK